MDAKPIYTVRITGPRMDTSFRVIDEDDLEILHLVANQICRRLTRANLPQGKKPEVSEGSGAVGSEETRG